MSIDDKVVKARITMVITGVDGCDAWLENGKVVSAGSYDPKLFREGNKVVLSVTKKGCLEVAEIYGRNRRKLYSKD